jgi:TolB-like protein
MKYRIWAIVIFYFFTQFAYSQIRVAVIPFQNIDGNMDLNIWSYTLQDTIAKALQEQDIEEKHFRIIPQDSIDLIVAESNLDPNNPQYASDMWETIKLLNAERIITGNFDTKANRILLNVYIYDIKTKLYDPVNCAKDIFKTQEKLLESIPFIVKKLLPALKK